MLLKFAFHKAMYGALNALTVQVDFLGCPKVEFEMAMVQKAAAER